MDKLSPRSLSADLQMWVKKMTVNAFKFENPGISWAIFSKLMSDCVK